MQRRAQSHSVGDCSPVGLSPGTSMGQTHVTCSQHVPVTYIPLSPAGRRPREKGPPLPRKARDAHRLTVRPFCLPRTTLLYFLYSPQHSFIHSSTRQQQQQHVESRSSVVLRFAPRQLNSAPPTAHASQPQGCKLNKPRGSDHEQGSEERGPDP